MPRTSNRRWKGCAMCKPHKFAQQGDGERQGVTFQRELGSSSRVNRHDLPDEEVRSYPAKKDRTRWCGGHPGREHTSEVQFCPDGNKVCGWLNYRTYDGNGGLVPRRKWTCQHRYLCSRCHKILGYIYQSSCPDYSTQETR